MKGCKVQKCVLYSIGLCLSSCIIFTSAYDCEPLSYRTGVVLNCEHPVTKESVDCRSDRVPIGTNVQYFCDEYFVTLDGDRTGGSMKCTDQGKWTSEEPFRAFSCSIDCGRQSDPNSSTYWPWHAAIFKRAYPSNTYKYACGGTLINPFNSGLVVLTSGRCLGDSSPGDLKVAIGLVTTELPQDRHSEESKIFTVHRIATASRDGIALIRLRAYVPLSRNVLPACFTGNPNVANQQLQENGLGQLVGFGSLSSSPSRLRNISLNVAPTYSCQSTRGGASALCASHHILVPDSADRKICSGDSGGGFLFPMFSRGSERHFVQGVLTDSFENREACPKFASFTRINDFAAWIRETTRQLYEESSKSPSKENEKLQIESTTHPSEIAFQRETPPTISPQFPQHTDSPQNGRPLASRPHIKPFSNTGNHRQRPAQSVSVINPSEYEFVGVDWHNYYRAKHGSPPVTLSTELNVAAQIEADRSLQENKYRFEGFTNFFGLNGGDLNSTKLVQEAITDWYKTSANYDYDQPRALAFTNVVWRATSQIGVGVGRKGSKQVVIVKYNRPLNLEHERERSFKENVFRPVYN